MWAHRCTPRSQRYWRSLAGNRDSAGQGDRERHSPQACLNAPARTCHNKLVDKAPQAAGGHGADALLRLPPMHNAALLLDVDGTLLDFASTPLAVVVPPELPGTLRAVKQRLGGALGMISGRPVEQVAALFGDIPQATPANMAAQHDTRRMPRWSVRRFHRSARVARTSKTWRWQPRRC